MFVTELEKRFYGKGEVKGFKFSRLDHCDNAYIYKVQDYYEVFKKKTVPKCVDFENKIYSDTEFKDIYPKSKDFGVWAWTFRSLEDASIKYHLLCS